MTARSLFLVSALCLIAMPVAAQAPDPIGTWISSRGIAVRKVFDGTREEQNPASIFLVREPRAQDPEFSIIDVAVKVREIEWNPWTSASILAYPVVDYHRSTNAAKLVNKSGGAGRIEFRPVGLSTPPPSGAAGPMPAALGTYWGVAPTFIFDAKLSRDWESKKNETKIALQVFPTTNIRGGPGSSIRRGDGTVVARWYPYAGVERYDLRAASDTTFITGLGRLWLEIWPIATPQLRFLQVIVDATSRHRIGGDVTMPNQLSDLTVGGNLYLDGNGHVGLGVDYANGRDATQRFARRERTTLGLKVKF